MITFKGKKLEGVKGEKSGAGKKRKGLPLGGKFI